jgi:uncharacterized membrane protein
VKWLRYLLAGVAGVVLLVLIFLVAVGGGRGEARHVRSVQIARPVNVVFSWMTEPARMRSWLGSIVEIRPLTPPPMAAGSRQIWVMEDRDNGNQRMEMEIAVTRFEPNQLFEAQLSVPGRFTGTVIYELQPIDAHRTHLTYRATYHYEHWLAKLFEPIVSRSAQQKLEQDLARLKQQAEAE